MVCLLCELTGVEQRFQPAFSHGPHKLLKFGGCRYDPKNGIYSHQTAPVLAVVIYSAI